LDLRARRLLSSRQLRPQPVQMIPPARAQILPSGIRIDGEHD
jgi:hypothetical protein